MKHFTKTRSYFFRFLLLLFFVGYYGSITLYVHAHLINGQIVYHSHPYKPIPVNNSPFQSHSHSSATYNLIQQLNETNWNSSISTPEIPESSVLHCRKILCCNVSPSLAADSHSCVQLRAPPAC